ncbi:MAG: hypothetical protein MI748_02360 [Opitutales bacterium]|nr:hypothetical protein [Opitutales bacterium]
MEKLRKRRILVSGYGQGVLAFCDAFRSEYAELTVCSPELRYAPPPVLPLIASDAVSPEYCVRSLRIRFGRRKDINWIQKSIVKIDAYERKAWTSESDEPLEYDYLIVGEDVEAAKSLRLKTYREAANFAKEVKLQTGDVIALTGSEPDDAETAIGLLSKPAQPTIYWVKQDKDLHMSGLTEGYHLRRAGLRILRENEIQKIASNHLLMKEHQIDCRVVDHRMAKLPNCLDSLDLETDESDYVCCRSDMSLPDHPRIFLLPEIASSKDGLGKIPPKTSRSFRLQAKHLAKTIKGKLEGKPGYDVDSPPFVYRDMGSLIRISTFLVVGPWRNSTRKGLIAWLLDTIFHKLPEFTLLFGFSEGIANFIRWTRTQRPTKLV